MLAKIKTMVVVWTMALAASAAGAPAIKDWSSQGGNPQNKDNVKDRMYLVNPGDKITFSVKADGAKKYVWQVNKKVEKKATGEKFTWTVPDEKGIWEIHLTAFGKVITPARQEGKWRKWDIPPVLEQAHQEWVVSTMSVKEAPDFFDYFTDMRWEKREETDPWARPLKNWKALEEAGISRYRGVEYPPLTSRRSVVGASRGFLRPLGDGTRHLVANYLSVDSTTVCGTWKLWYKFPSAGFGRGTFSWIFAKKDFFSQQSYTKTCDLHHHCWALRKVTDPDGVAKKQNCSITYDGGGWFENGQWHQVTIIRTPDGWTYMYSDNIFEFWVHDDTLKESRQMLVDMIQFERHDTYADNIEVYEGRYLFPKKKIAYEDYIAVHNPTKGNNDYYPATRKGIVVRGRGVRLSDIAESIGKPSLFTYNSKTRTAVCNTDLVVHDAAQFVMKDETLKFRSDSGGERHFAVKYAAELRIEKSTITTCSEDRYFVWNNASSTTHFAQSILDRPDKIRPSKRKGGVRRFFFFPLEFSCYARFIIKDSQINNAAHMFFDSPYEMTLTNTRFTNMRELDIGSYDGVRTRYPFEPGTQRMFVKGDKSFWIYLDDVNIDGFTLSGLKFSGKKGPINITFMVNSLRDKLNIYDVDAKMENAVVRKSMPQSGAQSHTWLPYKKATKEGGIISRLGLVNCRFKSILVPTDKACAIPKYYLDVMCADGNGKPVGGAKITVTNEVDNKAFPAENIEHRREPFYPFSIKNPRKGDDFFLHNRLVQGLAHNTASTGPDGHTPLPSERKNTLVLTDFVQDKGGRKEFTYTITVEKDGKKKVITGVNPGPDWYRPDPNKPTYTITAVLDGKTVTEAELKKKHLAGSP